MNAVKENSSPEALKAILDGALADIEKIHKEIEVLQAEIDRVNHVTKEKIVAKPAAAGAAATTAAAAAAAAAGTTTAAAPAPAAPAPAATPAPTPETETPAPPAAVTPAAATDPLPAPETTTKVSEQPDMEEVNLTSTMTDETK